MRFRQVPPSFQAYLKRFTVLFILIGIIELVSQVIRPSFPVLHLIAKPMVMISLLIFYLQKQRQRHYLAIGWMLGAIIGSLLGDIFLMFEGKWWFILGLGSFLVAHVCYVFVFRNSTRREGEMSLIKRKPWAVVPFLIYAVLLILVLWPLPQGLAIPIIVYALVISVMALMALNRWKQAPEFSFGLVFMGAMLFILSDSLIAVDRFGPDQLTIPGIPLLIMVTYMLAQYLIITGILVYDWHPRPQLHPNRV